jgi:mRNA interferase MazF
MNRGDIYYAALDPAQGCEINNTRPVVIVSSDSNNKYSDIVTVVPVTSNIKKIFSFDVYLAKSNTQLKNDSKATCNQVRSISIKRIVSDRIGKVIAEDMKSIDNALRLHLSI